MSAVSLVPTVSAQAPLLGITFLAPDTAAIRGAITTKLVDTLISHPSAKTLKRLIVTSPGGDAKAGIRLGYWVHAQKLDIEVAQLCMSTCANYVFVAGEKKTIQPGALVVWHGSAEQENFRLRDEKYEQLMARANDSALDPEGITFIETNKKIYQHSKDIRAEQRAFFQLIGVDEYLTRLGQEPIAFKAAWTISVGSMNRFGVNNVSAPPEYGTPNYIVQAYNRAGMRNPPLALEIDQARSVINLSKHL